MVQLADRTVIVTGAGGGIGGAVAVQCAGHGANVVLVDRDETAAKEVLAGLTPGDHRVIAADVSDPAQVCAIFDRLTTHGDDLAGVVNAAGIVTGGEPWPAGDLARMRSVLDVNAVGTVLFTTLAARHGGQGDCAVVNIASVAAFRAHPPDPAYAASKAAVVAFTRSAAAAGAGIRVNALLPGVVRTRMLATTGTDGAADWIAPRLAGPLLEPGQVADHVLGLLLGDDNGRCWSVELDDTDPNKTVRKAVS